MGDYLKIEAESLNNLLKQLHHSQDDLRKALSSMKDIGPKSTGSVELDQYPTLGFDPAPGAPASVDDLATKLSTAVTGLSKVNSTLTSIAKGGDACVWEGETATAFLSNRWKAKGLVSTDC